MTKTHGMRRTPTYRKWASMIERVSNPKCQRWGYYGGRGITVCERWRDFSQFFLDMGLCPDGFTLERLDYNGNYEPKNCVWADRITQANNRRNNRKLSVNGVTLSVAQWSAKTGLSQGTIRSRLRYGFSAEDAVTLPVVDGITESQKAKIRAKVLGRPRNQQGQFI